MLLAKLKTTALVGVLLAMVLGLGGFVARGGHEVAAAPVPKVEKAADPGVVWLYNWQTGRLLAYRPDGVKLKEYTLPDGPWFRGITPDGTRFVFGAEPGGRPPKDPLDAGRELTLHTRPVGDDTPATDLGVALRFNEAVGWAPDGKRFYRLRQTDRAEPTRAVGIYDATGKEEKVFAIKGEVPVGWTADGRDLITVRKGAGPTKPDRLSRFTLADMKSAALFAGEYVYQPSLSPDGTKVLGIDSHDLPKGRPMPPRGVLTANVASGLVTAVVKWEKNSKFDNGLWSPDSKRVVYCRCDIRPANDDRVDGDRHFVVCDADGKREMTLFTEILGDTSASTRLYGWTTTPPALKEAYEKPK